MSLFVIERQFADILDVAGLDHEGIKAVNDDVGIRWLYSFLSADKKKTYCLYEAPSAEAIREAETSIAIGTSTWPTIAAWSVSSGMFRCTVRPAWSSARSAACCMSRSRVV